MPQDNLWLELVRATVMVASDRPSFPVDAIYVHGLSEGMEASASIFDTAVEPLFNNNARHIAYNGSDGEGAGEQNRPGAAWPGQDWCRKELMRRLPDPALWSEVLVPTGPALHTRGETDQLVILAKERGWRSVAMLSIVSQAVRSMTCLVASMDTQGYWLKAHFLMPPRTDWWLPMLGSQGLEETDTFRHIQSEAEKMIEKYWQNGTGEPRYWRKNWAIPPNLFFHYLEYRDRIVAEQRFPL